MKTRKPPLRTQRTSGLEAIAPLGHLKPQRRSFWCLDSRRQAVADPHRHNTVGQPIFMQDGDRCDRVS